MGKLFNEEKVLYFANMEQALHVSCYEEPGTDLTKIVGDLKRRNLIVEVAEDDSGKYYQTTGSGVRRLLELQIQWRESRGKDASEHKTKLAELERSL